MTWRRSWSTAGAFSVVFARSTRTLTGSEWRGTYSGVTSVDAAIAENIFGRPVRCSAVRSGLLPTEPSIASRSRSACPLWRAVSSIMCSRIQRRENVPPVRRSVAADLMSRSPPISTTAARLRAEPRRTAPADHRARHPPWSASPSRGQHRTGALAHGSSSGRPWNLTWNQSSSTKGQVLQHAAERDRGQRDRTRRAVRSTGR